MYALRDEHMYALRDEHMYALRDEHMYALRDEHMYTLRDPHSLAQCTAGDHSRGGRRYEAHPALQFHSFLGLYINRRRSIAPESRDGSGRPGGSEMSWRKGRGTRRRAGDEKRGGGRGVREERRGTRGRKEGRGTRREVGEENENRGEGRGEGRGTRGARRGAGNAVGTGRWSRGRGGGDWRRGREAILNRRRRRRSNPRPLPPGLSP